MSSPRILIVEDDRDWQEIYRRCISNSGYEIVTTNQVTVALNLLQDNQFDVVITDLKMLGGNEEFSGFGVLEKAKALNPNIQVIVITGFGSANHAMRSMGSGAYDYITKDRDLRKKLFLSVQGALEVGSLKEEMLSESVPNNDIETSADRIIGNSKSMQELFEQITYASNSDVNVLIYGENGTGKRLIAQTIHRRSKRKEHPFLIVDCGRLSEGVLERELFGYSSGLLSGSLNSHKGKFERAIGGTVFLDGIGDLSLELQLRISGAIINKIIEPVGGQSPIPINVRIISSTDKELKSRVLSNKFHRHLFDAINEFVISSPPLRARKDGDDIPTLAAMFLQRYCDGKNYRFSAEALSLLQQYDYPGNVKELESAIKYALTVASDNEIITSDQIRAEIRYFESAKLQEKKDNEKNPELILKICPLNLGGCSKEEEILRIFSSRHVFVNVPDFSEYQEFEKIIRNTLEKYELIPLLAKDYMEATALCNTCKLIQICKYAITDVSFGSDILYKLGLVHAIGIHCAILKDHRVAQPAPIAGLHVLEYHDGTSLEKTLSRWVESKITEAKPIKKKVNSNLFNSERLKLRDSLINLFDESELRELCFILNVDYDSLPGLQKADKSLALITYMERRGKIQELKTVISQIRPNSKG